jgi:hypothetical protein
MKAAVFPEMLVTSYMVSQHSTTVQGLAGIQKMFLSVKRHKDDGRRERDNEMRRKFEVIRKIMKTFRLCNFILLSQELCHLQHSPLHQNC